MNLYDILRVQSTATSEEIKRAYRKLAMQFHPDRNPGDDAAANNFKQVQEAYDTLSDPNNRARYDGGRHTTKTKVKKPKTQRPYSGDGFVYRDAPPPKVDLWGQPILPEHEWVDAYSNNYENGDQPDIRGL